MTGVQEGSNISSLSAGSNGNSVKDVDCYDISVMGIESLIVKWEGGLLWKRFYHGFENGVINFNEYYSSLSL